MALVNGLPKATRNSPVLNDQEIANARLNNQFVLKGASPSFPAGLDNTINIVFLEYVQSTGTFTIEDTNGNVLSGALVTPLDLSHAPLRLEGGCKINGTILMAKGFTVIKSNLEV